MKLKIITTVDKIERINNSDKKIIKASDGKATVSDGKATVSDGKATVKKNLNQTQEQIIALIKENAKITIDDMATAIGITKRNIEKNIKILKDDGILLRIGSKKEGRWGIVG